MEVKLFLYITLEPVICCLLLLILGSTCTNLYSHKTSSKRSNGNENQRILPMQRLTNELSYDNAHLQAGIHRREAESPQRESRMQFLPQSKPEFYRKMMSELLGWCTDLELCHNFDMINVSVPERPSFRCCFGCSCGTTCNRTRSCCSDVQMTSEVSYKYTHDVNTVCRKATELGGKPKYEFVVTCPETSSEIEKINCEDGLQSEAALDGNPPVFDKLTLTNYINVYCAACNHANRSNLVMWWQANRCDRKSNERPKRSEFSEFECTLRDYVPPNEPGINVTVCHDDISECNVTGLWREYDVFLETACHHLQLSFVMRTLFSFRRFRNIFCALCNGYDLTDQSSNVDECTNFLRYTENYHQLLHSQVPADLFPTKVLNPCDYSGYKMDPISGRCREMQCLWPGRWNSGLQRCVNSALFQLTRYDIPLLIKLAQNVDICDTFDIIKESIEDLSRMEPVDTNICGIKVVLKVVTPIGKDGSVPSQNDLPALQVQDIMLVVTIEETVTISDFEDVSLKYNAFRKNIEKCNRFAFDAFDPMIIERPEIAKAVIQTCPGIDDHVVYTYTDPYDGHTLMDLSTGVGIDQCEDDFMLLFTASYIACPLFEYNLTSHNLRRQADGIVLEGSDVKFGFDEFRSMNETYIQICADSVVKKVPLSGVALHRCTSWLYLSLIIAGVELVLVNQL